MGHTCNRTLVSEERPPRLAGWLCRQLACSPKSYPAYGCRVARATAGRSLRHGSPCGLGSAHEGRQGEHRHALARVRHLEQARHGSDHTPGLEGFRKTRCGRPSARSSRSRRPLVARTRVMNGAISKWQAATPLRAERLRSAAPAAALVAGSRGPSSLVRPPQARLSSSTVLRQGRG